MAGAPTDTLSFSAPAEGAGDLPDGARYDVRGALGAGGMGVVERVWDRRLERFLARKRMRASHRASPGQVARFRTESRVTAGLDHRGIVIVFDAGEDQDGPWYTMRLVEGHRTLRDVVGRRGAPSVAPPGFVLPALAAVAEAMAFAHARGVIHRDLKPENVLVGPATADGSPSEVLVIDWGLARRVGVDPPEPSGTVLGTPGYRAPEQVGGGGAAHGPWSDVYALGAMLAELDGEGSDVLRDLARVCLAEDPAGRPADGAAVHAVLRAVMETRAAEARARVWTTSASRHLESRAELSRRVEVLRAGLAADAPGPGTPFGVRSARWPREDEGRALELELVTLDVEAELACRQALAELPTHLPAWDQLGGLYAERLIRAEQGGDLDAARRAERLLAAVHHPRWRGWVSTPGAFSLVTDPPGARVTLARFELVGRRRVPRALPGAWETPIEAIELPHGSYVATITAAGRPPVTYPFLIERGEHWDGVPPGAGEPLAVPLPDGLGTDEVYVPPGPVWLGDPSAPNGLPRVRGWVDGFMIQTCPVRVRDWLAWLDDRTANGRATEGLAPGAEGGVGPLALIDGQWRLVTDGEGDRWDLDWPVLAVDWRQARTYAADLAAARGQPWRLPWEVEWEKAARGVDGRAFPWGAEPEPTWFHGRGAQAGVPSPSPVGRYPIDRSVYGALDMAGNARTWCLDRRHAPLVLTDGRWTPPEVDEAPAWRSLRGGAWSVGVDYGRCAARVGAPADHRGSVVGVRLVRSWPG